MGAHLTFITTQLGKAGGGGGIPKCRLDNEGVKFIPNKGDVI